MYPYNVPSRHATLPQKEIPSQAVPTRQQRTSTYYCDRKTMELLQEALSDAMQNTEYYNELEKLMKNKTDKTLVRSMYLDEVKQNKLLSEAYKKLTGQQLPSKVTEKKIPSLNILNNLEEQLFDELAAVEFYRQLYFMIPLPDLRDTFFEIITDKQNHAQKLNYLFQKLK